MIGILYEAFEADINWQETQWHNVALETLAQNPKQQHSETKEINQ
jgi:hypothetical protein